MPGLTKEIAIVYEVAHLDSIVSANGDSDVVMKKRST